MAVCARGVLKPAPARKLQHLLSMWEEGFTHLSSQSTCRRSSPLPCTTRQQRQQVPWYLPMSPCFTRWSSSSDGPSLSPWVLDRLIDQRSGKGSSHGRSSRMTWESLGCGKGPRWLVLEISASPPNTYIARHCRINVVVKFASNESTVAKVKSHTDRKPRQQLPIWCPFAQYPTDSNDAKSSLLSKWGDAARTFRRRYISWSRKLPSVQIQIITIANQKVAKYGIQNLLKQKGKRKPFTGPPTMFPFSHTTEWSREFLLYGRWLPIHIVRTRVCSRAEEILTDTPNRTE